ncbi:MAG: hypothetical protein GY861_18475 [bacterium]|nr:hypothetical protein [bacterium]
MVINQVIKDALTRTSKDEVERMKKKGIDVRNPRYAYIAPTYSMAKNIAWDYLKHYTSVIPGRVVNESELRIDFPNGARIRLYGADNPDSLRGIYLDGVVMDEYAQIRPSLFSEVIRPTLSDREGYAIFIGTPKGKNHFYDVWQGAGEGWYKILHKAIDTQYVAEAELEDSKKMMTSDEYAQEYECSWSAAIRGAYYSEEMKRAIADQRLCSGIYDRALPVNTYWDIGFKDDTAIVFTQFYGKEIRVIDFYANSGMAMPDYIAVLRERGYKYGDHFFPHDARTKSMTDGKSVAEVAQSYDLNVLHAPMLSIQDGINQGRTIFDKCWFEKDKCAELLEALSQYRREWDDKKQTFRQNPLHDWTSHAADAFRYMAVSYNPPVYDEEADYEDVSELPYDPSDVA